MTDQARSRWIGHVHKEKCQKRRDGRGKKIENERREKKEREEETERTDRLKESLRTNQVSSNERLVDLDTRPIVKRFIMHVTPSSVPYSRAAASWKLVMSTTGREARTRPWNVQLLCLSLSLPLSPPFSPCCAYNYETLITRWIHAHHRRDASLERTLSFQE